MLFNQLIQIIYSTTLIFNIIAKIDPINEFNKITLSHFNGVRICSTNTCSNPIISISGITICIGSTAPS